MTASPQGAPDCSGKIPGCTTVGIILVVRRVVMKDNAALYLFARKAMRSGRTGIGEKLWEARFSLLLHSTTVGHSEQVHPVAI